MAIVIAQTVAFSAGVIGAWGLFVGFYSVTWQTFYFIHKHFNTIFYTFKGRRLLIDAWPYKYWLLIDYENDLFWRRKKSLHDPDSKYLQLSKPELNALLKCTYWGAWTSTIMIWGFAVELILISLLIHH